MMRSLFALLLLCLGAVANAEVTVQAYVPEPGFYWNPNQPGRGYAIEIQDRTLFMTAYVFTDEADPASRTPIWYTAAGLAEGGVINNRVVYIYAGELQYTSGGQCIGCPFVDPDTTPSGINIRIEFLSRTTASMALGNEIIDLVRFWYTDSISDPVFAMYGQWMVVTDFTDVDNGPLPFDGDLLEIGFAGSSGGQRTAEGFRGGTAIVVSGAYDELNDFYVIVVAEETNRFLAYYFFGEDFGTRDFSGFAERFVPGQDLTGAGFPAYGHRISDRTFAENILGAKRNTEPRPGPTRPFNRPTGPKSKVDAALLNRMARMIEARLPSTE